MKGLTAVLGALPLLLPPVAAAQERWQAAEDRAEAALPAPQGETVVASARMICAEQRWSFELATEEADATLAEEGEAEIRVDSAAFAAQAAFVPGRVEVAVPLEALDPLKRGMGLSFRFDGESTQATFGDPQFSLAGSRIAITAMEDICSRPDMSAYRALTFSPYSSYIGLARRLREEDMAQFRLATSSEPELTVAMAEFGSGRRVLFTRLCGSSWYFGQTGCNVTGFAPGSGEEEWQIVYDTEGVALHVDHAHDEYGWPDLVTLPLRGRGEASRWRWRGAGYGLVDGGM